MMVLYPHKNHQRVLTVFTVANKSQPCESATGSSSVTPTPHTPMFYKKISCPILFYSNIFIKFSPTFLFGEWPIVHKCTELRVLFTHLVTRFTGHILKGQTHKKKQKFQFS